MQPVEILSALFRVICSCCMCVVSVSGCPAVWLYVSIDLMYRVYTRVMSFSDWPKVVLVSTRRTLSRIFALVFKFLLCGMKVIFCHMSYVICHMSYGNI